MADTKVLPPMRKRVQVIIIDADSSAALQGSVNAALEDIFADPLIYEVGDIKYQVNGNSYTALIYYFETYQHTEEEL